MPNLYATIEQIQMHGYQFAERDNARIEPLIEMQSRLLDIACGLPPGYFTATADGAAKSSRTFYGDGTDSLIIDPYSDTIAAADISLPTAYTKPEFIELNKQSLRANQFDFALVRSYSDGVRGSAYSNHTLDEYQAFNLTGSSLGWYDGVPVTVSAKWGFVSVPMDVVLAVIEMTIAGMRGIDQAYMRVTNLDTNTVTNADALTPRARMIADKYNNARMNFA
jgi:hypothetical protein